jgi:hypothetical protein
MTWIVPAPPIDDAIAGDRATAEQSRRIPIRR